MSCTVHSFCWVSSLKLLKAASARISPMPFQLLPPPSPCFRDCLHTILFLNSGLPLWPLTPIFKPQGHGAWLSVALCLFWLCYTLTPFLLLLTLSPSLPIPSCLCTVHLLSALHVSLHNYSISPGRGCSWDAGADDGLHLTQCQPWKQKRFSQSFLTLLAMVR